MNAVAPSTTASPLTSDLTCIVCMDIILPPIQMCSNKHNICAACNTKLVRHAPGNCFDRTCTCRKVLCPMCRVDIKGDKLLRNNDLETLAKNDASLAVPCPYAPGCTETMSYLEMIDHASKCPKKPAPQQVIEVESDSEGGDNGIGMDVIYLFNLIGAALRQMETSEAQSQNAPPLVAPVAPAAPVPPVSPIAPRANPRMHGGTRELPLRRAALRGRYNVVDEPYPARRIPNNDSARRTIVVPPSPDDHSEESNDGSGEPDEDEEMSGESDNEEMPDVYESSSEEEDEDEEEEEEESEADEEEDEEEEDDDD